MTIDSNDSGKETPVVAVVLSTYNGSRYIVEQLDSLLSQTRLPNKICICDDCSTDDTPDVVSAYIAEHNISSINFDFSVNKENAGWKANFRRLILDCEADYLFLCDQDDIWEIDKIELMVRVMEERPDLDLLACSVTPIYESGSRKTGASTEQSNDGDYLKTMALSPSFMRVSRPGCTYCVRKSFTQRILPYWKDSYPHDATLWRLALLEDGVGLLNRRLVRFRRHAGNASGRQKQSRIDRLDDIDYYIDFIEQAKSFVVNESRCSNEAAELVHECALWLDSRKQLLLTGRLSDAVRCFGYRRFYNTGRALVLDMLLAWVKDLKV